MLSILLLTLAQAQRKICICNLECSSSCPSENYIITSSNFITQHLYTSIKLDKEIELSFYSQKDEFVYEIDMAYFSGKKLTLKNLFDSRKIKIKIKEETTNTIEIEPNYQINLPNLNPIKSTYYDDKAVLTELIEPSTTPIPISVGISQFKSTGNITCDRIICPTENLDLPSAYQCGLKCWTSGPTTFEYAFKGIKFAIYGTISPNHKKFSLKIDENDPIEINEEAKERQEYVELYISNDLDYKDHTIQIYGDEKYELYKITYWPSKSCRRLNSTELQKTRRWTKESDKIGGTIEITNETGAKAVGTIRASKIWIYGSKSESYGEMKVKFNGQEKIITEKSETSLNNILLYESETLNFDTYELELTLLNGSMSIGFIYYQFDPPGQLLADNPIEKAVPISIGLAQMITSGGKTCEPSDFDINKVDQINCDFTNLDQPEAYNCGYRCYGSQMNFEYNFKGVMFQVFGTIDPNHRKFDLIIDDGEPIEIDEYSEQRKAYFLLYTSEELEYKEHNIKIANKDQTYEMYKITYWPSLRAKRVNISDFTKTGTWISQSDGIGGAREYTESNGATAEITIKCSKLWVYGSTANWFQNFNIEFNGEEKNINPFSNDRVDAVLFYETEDISFDTYTLKITAPVYPITIYYIYYVDDYALPTLTATQTPDPSPTPDPTNTPFPSHTPSLSPDPSSTPEPSFTPLPTTTPTPTPVPISVGLTQMEKVGRVYCNVAYFGIENIQNLGCNTDDLEAESAYKCGYKCWTHGEANFTYTFKGVKFDIYGTFDPFHRKFDLTIDDQETIEIDEYSETRNDYVVVYSSDELEYKDHTVKINGKGGTYELYKLVYWPRNEARRMNSTELDKVGEWKKESDGIGGVREYTNNAGDTASVTFVCTKIWIYSSICNWHNNVQVRFNNRNYDISLNSQVRQDGYLIFESEDVPYGEYTLSFTSGGTIMICYIYYLNDPPPPTRTPYPSRTEYPETRETYIDKTFTNYILTDQIEVTEISPIDQISGCQFINILEDIDYLIRIEKEIPFFDNSFQYKVNQSNPCAPIIFNFNGKFSIVNCTFINSRCRTRYGGNVFTSPSNFVVDLNLDSCKFIDCGMWQNETIVKILNSKSSINMTDCSFSFQNETTASKVINGVCSSISIDNCSFFKCGSILIDSEEIEEEEEKQNYNLSFIFTNNKINSINQPFICLPKVSSVLIIENNIFHEIQLSNLSFINITHDLDEIELKNNSFENVKADEFESFGGSFFILIQNIENLSTTIIFNKCFFFDNENNRSSESFYGMGGAFQYGYFQSRANVSIQFVGCEFKRNSCINGKGGAIALSIFDDVVISDCVFEGNNADGEGSSIYFSGDSNLDDQIQLDLISITNCRFIDSIGANCINVNEEKIKVETVEIYSCVFLDNDCEMYLIQTSSNNVNFVNNSVTFSDIGNKFGSFNINYTKLAVLTDTVFNNCLISSDVSLLFNGKDDSVITTFSNCTFTNCIARRFSASIRKGSSTVTNCTFTFTSNRNACSGLEINSPKTVEISECKFLNNNNKYLNSGSLYIHDETGKSPDKLTINGLIFTSCIGSSFRTLSVSFNSIQDDILRIEKVEIREISTGASIYGINVNKDVIFENCIFTDNSFGNQLGGGYGSYLIPPHHISFVSCSWTNNYCSDNGGAFGGVINNVGNTPLLLKSLTFQSCNFTSNSCLGNAGALYIDMSAENSIVSIVGSRFEMNRANGDCGAIYAKNKGHLNVEDCFFKNNTATKSILPSIDPTDSLYVTGNFDVLINSTNFTKGSYIGDQTNYQFTHINSEENDNKPDFVINISHCMFSIINPTNGQLFAQEKTNIGSFYISFSTFTHFATRNSYAGGGYLLNSERQNRASQSDFNHLFSKLDAPVHILDCCFDNDEYIIASNQASSLTMLSSSFTSKNNVVNGVCFYPEIIDEMIFEIESYENRTNKPPSNPDPKNSNKMIIIIASVVVAVVVIVAVVLTVVFVLRCRKKNSQSDDSEDEEDAEAEKEENERNFANFATKMVTQENPLYTHIKQTRFPSSDDSSFEESRWNDDFI